jgi:DNA-directed RNA polymerase subunit N (RpoN/RPB10)
MEAYKSACKSCGKEYFWTGYKTGIGKTEEQLKQMHDEMTICKYCKAPGLVTNLDHETEDGQLLDDEAAFIAESIMLAFSGKLNETNK